MLKVIKIFKTIMFCVTALALGALVYSFYSVPDEICTVPNEKISINEIYSLEYVTTEMTEKEIQSFSDEGDYKVNVKLFNAMPIKTMNMKISKRRYVVPSGEIFGLRLFTDGVIIVGTNDIETENGTKNSATEAGVKIGDAIISINGKSVRTCSEVSEIFASYNGTPFDLCYERDGKQYNTKFTLYYSQTDNKYIAGLWIRDSAAGIGTLT
ncbi:MAG: PDZ domain-containing protein, partial [Acutalibacteraceae bacterium]